MEWKMFMAVIVAAGSLAATAARAQDNAAATGATATEGQTTTADPYGTEVDGPATTDAEGVPVAKPNPMSDFLKQAQQQGETGIAIEMPLVSDFRTDDSTTDGQPN